VIGQYQAAYNERDAAAIVRIVPSLPEAKLKSSFDALRSYRVEIVEPHVSIDGSSAHVTCVRNISVNPRVGTPQNRSVKTTFRLRRAAATWIIDGVDDH